MHESKSDRTGAGSWRRAEIALGVGAMAMAVGAFVGHLIAPERVAEHYGWPRDRWYQREVGAFNAGLGYGVIAYARGRSDAAFLGSWGTAAIALALTRAAAVRSGARNGWWNVVTVIEDATLGLGAFAVLAARSRSRRSSPTDAAARRAGEDGS